MTYGGQFLKFTFQFVIADTVEIADTSINYSALPGWTGAAAALAQVTNDDLLDIGSQMTALMQVNFWADYSTFVGIKAAAIGTDGVYLVPPVQSTGWTDTAGTAGNIPPQSSIVLSLRTNTTLGTGNYGRMYLPHSSFPLTTDTPRTSGVVTAGTASAASDAIDSWTVTLNAHLTDAVLPVIMSQASGLHVKPVTKVAVGDLVDTQRRRRRQIAESYSFSDLS